MGILQQNNPFKFFIFRILAKFRNQETKKKEKKKKRWAKKVLQYKVVYKYTSK